MADDVPPMISDITVLELYKSAGGVIRSDKVTLAIAKAILADLYGDTLMQEQTPFVVSEQNGRWIVRGSPKDPGYAASIVLARSDARVIYIDVRQAIE